MFYIEGYSKDSSGKEYFSIRDTDDNTVDDCSISELRKFAKLGIKVYGYLFGHGFIVNEAQIKSLSGTDYTRAFKAFTKYRGNGDYNLHTGVTHFFHKSSVEFSILRNCRYKLKTRDCLTRHALYMLEGGGLRFEMTFFDDDIKLCKVGLLYNPIKELGECDSSTFNTLRKCRSLDTFLSGMDKFLTLDIVPVK